MGEIIMKKLMKYFKNKNAEIVFADIELTAKQLEIIPPPLQEFYKKISSVDIQYVPFTNLQIFTIETAIEDTKRFKIGAQDLDNPSNWFVFGQGIGEEHLLCAFEQDEEGLWFTSWQHDCEEIGGACCKDLLSLIEDNEENQITKLRRSN